MQIYIYILLSFFFSKCCFFFNRHKPMVFIKLSILPLCYLYKIVLQFYKNHKRPFVGARGCMTICRESANQKHRMVEVVWNLWKMKDIWSILSAKARPPKANYQCLVILTVKEHFLCLRDSALSASKICPLLQCRRERKKSWK